MDLGVSASTVSILTSEGWDKEVRGACVVLPYKLPIHGTFLRIVCVIDSM